MKSSNVNLKSLCILFAIILLSLNFFTLSADALTLSWNPPLTSADGTSLNDLGGYVIYSGTEPGSYSQSIDVGNVTSFSLNNLAEGLVYYFAVTAYDLSGNESDYSNEVSRYIESVDTTSPVISGIYADNISSSSANIHWTTDEAADTQVEYGTTPYYGSMTSLDSSLVTIHGQTVNVAPSTQYYYRVISRDASGNQTVSDSHTFTSAEMMDITPPVISNIQVTDITPSSATITWMTDEASTSQVKYGAGPEYANVTSPDTNLVTIHSVHIAELSSYTNYQFKVVSMDSKYNESVSDGHTFMTSNLPPEITLFSANPDTGFATMAVDFSSSASDIDGYVQKHEWDFDGDGQYDKDTGAVSDASYTYLKGGTYHARLRIQDNGGASVISSALTITVEEPLNRPPVVSALHTDPTEGIAPLTVTLSAEAADPDGMIIRYEWDFDGNGTYDAETETNQITHVYSSPGNYPVNVRVSDNYESRATGEALISVRKGRGSRSGNGSGNGNGNGYGKGKKN